MIGRKENCAKENAYLDEMQVFFITEKLKSIFLYIQKKYSTTSFRMKFYVDMHIIAVGGPPWVGGIGLQQPQRNVAHREEQSGAKAAHGSRQHK